MGRRPKPVEGEIEALALLAADLRRLRHAAGNPPYRVMAVKARYSASTLSEAASGRRLPTMPVVLAYVAACGADTEEWQERWRQAAAAVHGHDESSSAGPAAADENDAVTPAAVLQGVEERENRRGIAGRGWAIGGALLALLLAGTLGGLYLTTSSDRAAHAAVPPSSSTSAGSPRTITEDTDPKDAGCDKGQVSTAASANLYAPDRFFVGYIWLRYAPECGAMWARFEPAAGLAALGGAKVTIWLTRPSDGRTLRYDTPYLGAFVYGNMLRTSHGCLKAEATVTAPHPTQGPAAALPGTGPVVAHAETSCALPPAPSSSVNQQQPAR